MYIIIVCIILLLVTWVFYFKSVKEGNDPHAANYTMPISFTGEKNSNTEKIKVPQFIETNNGQNITLVNDTNLGGNLNMNQKKVIGLGSGHSLITTNQNWGGRNELEIVGAGNCDNGCNRYIHMWDDVVVDRNLNVNNGNLNVNNDLNMKQHKFINFQNGSFITSKHNWENDPNSLQIVGCDGNGGRRIHMWDHVCVNNNLEVKHGDLHVQNGHGIHTNWMNTGGINTDWENVNHLNVGNSHTMRGMQAGSNWEGRDNGYINFNPWFSTNKVFVLITKINGHDDPQMVTYTAHNISERGFNYRQAGTYQGSDWAYVTHWPGTAFNWVAFAMG